MQKFSPEETKQKKEELDRQEKNFQEFLETKLTILPNNNGTNTKTNIEALGEQQATLSRAILKGNTSEKGDIDPNIQNTYSTTLSYLIAYLDVCYRLQIIDIDDINTVIYHYSIRILDEYEYQNRKEEDSSSNS